ncbi:MAG TPA: response regulator [Bacteroidia bacterium]|nr:response regulator [Bacteroidia bacterium]
MSSLPRILIVDDSILIGNRVRELLTDYHLVELIGQAYNIEDGRELIEKEHPDLVILDIGFPGRSGMLLIEEIKKLNDETVVVMFTNYSHVIYRNKCKELGADHFFDKSTDLELLMSFLESFQRQKLIH